MSKIEQGYGMALDRYAEVFVRANKKRKPEPLTKGRRLGALGNERIVMGSPEIQTSVISGKPNLPSLHVVRLLRLNLETTLRA